MQSIPHLQKGDKIIIVAPAKGIEPSLVFDAKDFWENQGYVVEIGEFCIGKYHYFSGTDQERLKDFQEAIDDPTVKAIVCARGGYGCVRILDLINWSGFIRNPKWIVGFSDVTVFHQHLQRMQFPSIHATMPLNYTSNSVDALESLVHVLEGKKVHYALPGCSWNINGKASGKLIGGNLSIVYSLLGTDSQADFQESILFLEDLAEQLYHIDRMFYALQKAGILHQIKGLIIGGFTDLKDVEHGFGKKIEELILDHISYRQIPVCFQFPAGHIDDNRALLMGGQVELTVENEHVTFQMIKYEISKR